MENNRISIKDQFEALRNKQLMDSNKLEYNANMCRKIKRDTSMIVLPKLTNTEMSSLKEHLVEYKKVPNDDLAYKFLNLYNSFTLIYKFEDNPELKRKINPIIIYLKNYEHIINLIIESQGKRETPILDKAMIMLHLEINMFCMQYAYILNDVDNSAINWQPIIPDQDIPNVEDLPEDPQDPFSQYEDGDED